jgi:YfiH family protein
MRLVHIYTDRAAGDMNRSARRAAALASVGLASSDLVYGSQVHGTLVREVGRADRGGPRIEGIDGFVTREAGVALMVFGADCPLVLLHDPLGPAIAVVHAGWRGLAAGILPEALRVLGPKDPGAVRAFLGPCAGPCCYEVGDEVAARFPAAAVRREAGGRGGRPRLDLPAAVELSLGLSVDRSAHRCTICSPDCFSYRRTGARDSQALIAAFV